MRSFASLFIAALALGCAPTLRYNRQLPPRASLEPLRSLSLDARSDMKNVAQQAVMGGLLRGEIPIPVPTHPAVAIALRARLQQLGFTVCTPAPCGDGAMTVELLESEVNGRMTDSGAMARVRLKARVLVTPTQGEPVYDWDFSATRNGRQGDAGQLVASAAEGIADTFASTLLPGREQVRLQLEDGGALSPGVNMLLSSNWDGAVAYFSQLTREQPELDGAWYDLGVACEGKGDWVGALGAYEQASARSRKSHYLSAVRAARARQPPPPQLIPPEEGAAPAAP